MANDAPLTQTPDTLDLAEYGRMAVNGVLGSCDPEREYENYFLTFFDVQPAYMIHFGSQVSGVLPKYLEAMPLVRLMSGSDQDRDIEQGMLDSVLRNIAEDGLIYDRSSPSGRGTPASATGSPGWDEDYSNMAGNGRLLTGLLYYYHATGDDEWKRQARRTAERMLELTVTKDDYAYYPNVGLGNDFSYPRVSGWTHTDEPDKEFEGSEGMTSFYTLQPVRGFARWYQETGDERFLDISRRLVSFCTRRRFWGGLNDLEPLAGAERGHFWGQFHGRAAALRGILDYAIAADDYRAKEFVRDGYEWARHQGIHRLGVFPGNGGNTEGCTVADMVGLAVKLTDAGIGEYWEDVDQYVRNGLLAIQATDIDEMRRVSEQGPERPADAPWGGDGDMRFEGFAGVLPGQETNERVLERAIGAFGHLDGARFLKPRLMHCCTGNGAQALYHGVGGHHAAVRRHRRGEPVAQPSVAVAGRGELVAVRGSARPAQQGPRADRGAHPRLRRAAVAAVHSGRPGGPTGPDRRPAALHRAVRRRGDRPVGPGRGGVDAVHHLEPQPACLRVRAGRRGRVRLPVQGEHGPERRPAPRRARRSVPGLVPGVRAGAHACRGGADEGDAGVRPRADHRVVGRQTGGPAADGARRQRRGHARPQVSPRSTR